MQEEPRREGFVCFFALEMVAYQQSSGHPHHLYACNAAQCNANNKANFQLQILVLAMTPATTATATATGLEMQDALRVSDDTLRVQDGGDTSDRCHGR
jgi:hypothetical protein